jgi:hypothetical protein
MFRMFKVVRPEKRLPSIHRWSAIAMSLLVIAGCGEKGPSTIPVYGKITFTGRELPPVVSAFFKPIKVDGLKRPATTDMEKDGSYKVKAFASSRGLIPGTYRIEIVYSDLKPGKDPNMESSWIVNKFDAGEVQVDAGSSGVEHNIEVPKKS